MYSSRVASRILVACALLMALGAGIESALAQCAPLYTFTGEAHRDQFGISVSDAGDVDNDGYVDLIVGADWNDAGGTDAGRAYVYSGRTGGLLWAFTGEAAYDHFGFSVSGASDVDNDGYDDLIVGAHGNDAGGDHAGRAYVYSGQTGVLMWTFTGESADDWFGYSVSGAGDVDNDGCADLIVGAYWNDAAGVDPERAYVYSGQTGVLLWTLTGEAKFDKFGYSVSGAGDVDNDGHADVIVGAIYNDAGGPDAGRAYVYSGRTGGQLWTFAGTTEEGYFGYSVSGAGDVDDDGYADLIVGENWNDAGGDKAGRAYVYSGQTGALLWTFTGEAAGDQFGQSVSGVGDVDDDGHDDVVIGAPLNEAGGYRAGRVYVYSGQTGAPLRILTGKADYEYLGISVSGAGDVNLDGYDDLIAGAYWSSVAGLDPGQAYVFACPPPGSVVGRVTADCPSPETGVQGVEVAVCEPGSSDPSGTTLTDSDGNYQIDDLAPGDYTVSIIVPPGYNAATNVMTVTVLSGDIITADFALTCLPGGSVAGRVYAACPPPDCPGNPCIPPYPETDLYGVTVDVFEVGTGLMAGSAVTGVDGMYQIDDLMTGSYVVTIVTPLGYTAAVEERLVTVIGGEIGTANFTLGCIEIVASPRMVGFWKHQFGAAVSGNGEAQIDAAALCGYLDLIAAHFNSNEMNQVVVYSPDIPVPPDTISSCTSNLAEAISLLNLQGSVSAAARARQQLMAVLLNVASERISLTAPVSDDGATLSQAITYCDNVLDGPAGDHEAVRMICRTINSNQQVPAGVIPLTTPDIAYRSAQNASYSTAVPTGFVLHQNYPNPFNAGTVIPFELEHPGDWELRIYNVAGQTVWSEVGHSEAGRMQVTWSGRDRGGRPLASGVYFCRLTTGAHAAARKMVLIR